jgi:hypothetical protein
MVLAAVTTAITLTNLSDDITPKSQFFEACRCYASKNWDFVICSIPCVYKDYLKNRHSLADL